MNKLRIAVIGTGTIGAHVMWMLSRRPDVEVHGFDRYAPGHPFGAAGGEGRLMGSVHGQRADYDDLYARAFQLWGELERDIRRPLRVSSGKLTIGAARDIKNIYTHGRGRGHPYEFIDNATLRAGYPFQTFDDEVAVLDRDGGMIRSELAVSSAAQVAQERDAVLHTSESVLELDDDRGVVVTTAVQKYRFDRAVVTAGAWSRQFLPSLTEPVKIYRPVLAWFAPLDDTVLTSAIPFSRFNPQFYGVPTLDRRLLRLGYAGVRQRSVADHPRPDDYHVGAELGEFPDIVARHFPGLHAQPVRVNAYFEGYTETADPVITNAGRLTLAAGFSGNGFKFAPAYGEMIADLATTGDVRPEARFLLKAPREARAASPGRRG